jgi:hypothetical protein
MAFVDWTDEALDSLAHHDVWRISQGWEPIAEEIYDVAEAYFSQHHPEQPPHFIPGKSARRLGHPVDMRVVHVVVRNKPFRVFFRYCLQVFEIRRVDHPRAK